MSVDSSRLGDREVWTASSLETVSAFVIGTGGMELGDVVEDEAEVFRLAALMDEGGGIEAGLGGNI